MRTPNILAPWRLRRDGYSPVMILIACYQGAQWRSRLDRFFAAGERNPARRAMLGRRAESRDRRAARILTMVGPLA